MASACVNNVPVPAEGYAWAEIRDPDVSAEFEFFRIEDPPPRATMLPADELFSDGKLVPLHISTTTAPPPEIKAPPSAVISPAVDNYAFSPRAPTCSIRWRNILRFKKLHLTKPNPNTTSPPSPPPHSATSNTARSLTSILNRVGSKAPAPKDSDTESVSTSSRLSLSSSSSSSSSSSHEDVVPKQRRSASGNGSGSSVLADSPRLNSSGKVVFERSSSSPGSFSGGPRCKHGRIERSYSAHVRVAPVLNVPVVCSIRGSSKFGFPLFAVGSNNNNHSHNYRMQRRNSKNGNRTEQP